MNTAEDHAADNAAEDVPFPALGRLLWQARLEKHLSLAALARRTDVTYNTARRWERGELRPGPDRCALLATHLNLPATALLTAAGHLRAAAVTNVAPVTDVTDVAEDRSDNPAEPASSGLTVEMILTTDGEEPVERRTAIKAGGAAVMATGLTGGIYELVGRHFLMSAAPFHHPPGRRPRRRR